MYKEDVIEKLKDWKIQLAIAAVVIPYIVLLVAAPAFTLVISGMVCFIVGVGYLISEFC